MCGRTSETAEEAELQAYLDRLHVSWRQQPRYGPRWNIAPGRIVKTITEDATGRIASEMDWGFYRTWSTRVLANARSETVATAKTFAEAFRSSRALVIVDGYYEWRQNRDGSKTPFRIHVPGGGLFVMAGLKDLAHPFGGPTDSCTILTAAATGEMRSIHSRMPVILADEAALEWINPDTEQGHLHAIIANSVRDLEMYPVSTYVNSSAHEGPACWEPAAA